ncbi:hypothetical protein AB4212_33440, partial [Streptomyces sp. 2MCAF27]
MPLRSFNPDVTGDFRVTGSADSAEVRLLVSYANMVYETTVGRKLNRPRTVVARPNGAGADQGRDHLPRRPRQQAGRSASGAVRAQQARAGSADGAAVA